MRAQHVAQAHRRVELDRVVGHHGFGQAEVLLQVEVHLQRQRLLGAAGRPVVRAEPDRDHGRRRDGPPVRDSAHLVVPEERVAVLHRGARASTRSRARRGTRRPRGTAPSADRASRARGQRVAASCHDPPLHPAGHGLAVHPGLLEQVLGVGPASCRAVAPARRSRSMPASSGAELADARRGSDGWPSPRHRGRRTADVPGDLRHVEDGRDAGVGAGQRLDPLVAGPGGEGGREGRPDGRLRFVVELGSRPARGNRARRRGWRRTWPRSHRRRPTWRRPSRRCRSRRSGPRGCRGPGAMSPPRASCSSMARDMSHRTPSATETSR